MTCIVGLVDKGKVWIGGDSAGIAGWSRTIRKDQKVFHNGEFLMGFTTSFRMGQLLRFKFKPPTPVEGIDDYEYLCTAWIDAVRECLKSGGFSHVDKNREEGGMFLVGWRGRLFSVDSDFQVGEPQLGYDAVGCGEDIALGALFATDGPPRRRVLTALKAAENFSIGVAGPFVIKSI